MPLSYYLNSTGGTKSLAYSLWYTDLNSDVRGSITNISIYVNSGQIHYVDVQDLVPMTPYILVLNVYDIEHLLFSDNITVTGATAGNLFSSSF